MTTRLASTIRFGLLLSVATLIVTGCIPFAPTRPSAIENDSITAQDDRIAVVQCIARDYRVNYVTLSMERSGGRFGDGFIYSSEIDYSDAVVLPYATPIIPFKLHAELRPRKDQDVRISTLESRLTIHVRMAGQKQACGDVVSGY